MARFIHSRLTPTVDPAADGVHTFDLPVNPLSVILLNIKPLNETSTIGTYLQLDGLLQAIEKIEVTWRGAAMVSLSAIDLCVLNALWHGIVPVQTHQDSTDDDRRSLVIPILFGRRAYDPAECFPRVAKGEMQLAITVDDVDTGYTDLTFEIETIELPEANPAHFQRVTTISRTHTATGDNAVDMPVETFIRAILCFGTTGYTGATPAPSLADIRVLLNNLEYGFAHGEFTTLRGAMALNGCQPHALRDHFHEGTYASATTAMSNLEEISGCPHENYVLLNYDPNRDDEYILDTHGAGRCNLLINVETADACRFLPVEKFEVSKLALGGG
jgi:hypothetical protein